MQLSKNARKHAGRADLFRASEYARVAGCRSATSSKARTVYGMRATASSPRPYDQLLHPHADPLSPFGQRFRPRERPLGQGARHRRPCVLRPCCAHSSPHRARRASPRARHAPAGPVRPRHRAWDGQRDHRSQPVDWSSTVSSWSNPKSSRRTSPGGDRSTQHSPARTASWSSSTLSRCLSRYGRSSDSRAATSPVVRPARYPSPGGERSAASPDVKDQLSAWCQI